MNTIPAIVAQELDAPFELTQEQIAYFRENGFVKIPGVLSKEALQAMDEIITAEVNRLNTQHLAMEDRDTYGKAFLQIMNIWRNSAAVKQIVFSKRLAKIAADLLEVEGVRIYHDQALYKEPGGGHTPWHADQYYWPLSNDRTVTAWIPLQETPLELGPLEFSARSFEITEGRDKEIGDESQAYLDNILRNTGFDHIVEAFGLGEVSFHTGWLYHRAGPNTTNQMRKVMTMIYMDKDMKLKAPENKNQQADWDAWCPGAAIGEVIDTEMNPVIFQ
ncbi:MAG: phytanoyl-CoA dioxygenase family protein [bacterium]|jgi:ectoine hydroxylase-related dioxygenase (phytanoyl-CoA dioxygenase family)